MKNLINFESWISLNEAIVMPPEIYGVDPDKYGETIGIIDKTAKNYKINDLNLPPEKPIGDIAKSAWANLNVPTRAISNTEGGNLGCAAATSIMFYRATGLPIVKEYSKNPIVLGTSALWSAFTGKDKDRWEIIKNWRTDYKPGDIILTSRGPGGAGHVGVVVEDGKIISNSSGGFNGDKKGQIELNYDIKSWESIAKKNPTQTACFRYKGDYLDKWGGSPIMTPIGTNDSDANKKSEELPNSVIKYNEILYLKPLDAKEMYSVLGDQRTMDKLIIKSVENEEPAKKKRILGLIKSKKYSDK